MINFYFFMGREVFYLANVQYILDLPAVEVGDANVLRQALLNHLLQGGPGHRRTHAFVVL